MIFFTQPAVPEYRVSFFEKIRKTHSIKVYSATVDFLGVESKFNSDSVEYIGEFINLCGMGLYWHKNLPLFRGYKKGDVVVVNGNPRIINYMMLLFISKLRGIKTIWWGHGWSANSHGLFSRIRIKMMYCLSDYQLVYTDKEKHELNKTTVFALNNGLDSEVIQKSRDRIECKKLIQNEKKIVSLFFIGRVSEKSNFSLLLDALTEVERDFSLHVIGSDDPGLASRHASIKNKIIWHGEVYNENEIAKIIYDLDFFVYPGAVGLSLIHAFNYGKPALIHNNPFKHMPEYAAFIDGYNGKSFQEGT